MTTLSHKIRIDSTMKQECYFRKACGTARFAWNWGLAKWEEKYKAGEKTSAFDLKKEFNSLKDSLFPWVYEVTKYACQQPFIYLQKAYQKFFNKQAKRPRFKKKGVHDSFYIGGDQLRVEGNRVKIPNLGWIRLRESLRFQGKITGATISRTASYWFISITVETDQLPQACENQATVGVDLGIKTLATFSDGKLVPNRKSLGTSLAKLRRLNRRVSRRLPGSANRRKARASLSKLHYQIACKRNDHLHKLTTHLTGQYRYIVIEDLDISSMVQGKKLSRHILDGGWYEFRRQLSYKASLRGNKIFVADKWYASSKRCSSCGNYKNELLLSERIYRCSCCQVELDRDLNAARNLEQLLSTVSSTGINACGQDGSVIMLNTLLQPAWQKQELSHV